MLVLAFDTAGNGCAVCVWDDGRVRARRADPMSRGQAEALIPMIAGTLADAGVTWPDVDRIAVTVGPGSFTGLRVGLATARALGLAAERPVVGVTTLEAFAAAVSEPDRAGGGTLLAAVDARRADVYLQPFDAADLTPLAAPLAAAPADVAGLLEQWEAPGPLLGCGDAVALLRGAGLALRDCGAALIDPAVVATLGAALPEPTAPPAPLYIRPPDAALPVGGGRLRP